jgi:hypothetical protein
MAKRLLSVFLKELATRRALSTPSLTFLLAVLVPLRMLPAVS